MIDSQLITDAILALDCSPLAKEEGGRLAESWIAMNHASDAAWEIIAVECGFVCWLDKDTVVIGVQDLLTTDAEGFIGNEWKTSREPNKWYNEGVWYQELLEGPQLGIYAVAAQSGIYYEHGTGRTFEPKVISPRLRVRAITKSADPQCWAGDGIVEFSVARLEQVKEAFLAKAAAIRGMRKAGHVPWQIPGLWCTNKYKRQCEYFGDCTGQKWPSGWAPFDSNDPAFTYSLPFIGERVSDPELVILGASAYSAYSECAEAGRRNTLAGNKEQSMALDVGSVFHAAIASYYRQVKEGQ